MQEVNHELCSQNSHCSGHDQSQPVAALLERCALHTFASSSGLKSACRPHHGIDAVILEGPSSAAATAAATGQELKLPGKLEASAVNLGERHGLSLSGSRTIRREKVAGPHEVIQQQVSGLFVLLGIASDKMRQNCTTSHVANYIRHVHLCSTITSEGT